MLECEDLVAEKRPRKHVLDDSDDLLESIERTMTQLNKELQDSATPDLQDSATPDLQDSATPDLNVPDLQDSGAPDENRVYIYSHTLL